MDLEGKGTVFFELHLKQCLRDETGRNQESGIGWPDEAGVGGGGQEGFQCNCR